VTSRHVVVLALAALLGGCNRSAPNAPPRVPLETTVVAEALETLSREAQSVRRYQGFLRIRGKGPDGGFSGRLVVIFERPGNLRIELLGAFGATRWAAVASPSGITVVFPGPSQYVQETDVADIVGRLLGVRLDAHEVMALLSGAGVPLEALSPAESFRQGERRVLLTDDGRRLEISDDDQMALAQTPSYRAVYPTSWKSRRRQIPDRLELHTEQITATLTVEAVDVNVSLDAQAFVVDVPADATRLRPSDVSGEAVFVAQPKTVRPR